MHAVVGHGLGDLLRLQQRSKRIEIRNVEEHGSVRGIVDAEERACRDAEGAEELVALRRGEPVLVVVDLVVADQGDQG